MQRRNAIKKIGLVTGGIFLFPSCNFSEEKSAQVIKEFQIDQGQEALLKDFISTVIPNGEIPGAQDLKVENFVWIMLKDTYDRESQLSYLKGLTDFERTVQKENAKSFHALSNKEKLNALYKLDAEIQKEGSSELGFFLEVSKNLAIQGYLQSHYIMTEIMPYQLVPGGHGNCEEISKDKRINLYG